MKNFLLKISLYIVAVILLFAILGSFADGNTDHHYMHFAVKRPRNIILGDSRGSQAVLPSVLETKLQQKFDNFSLNIVESPYGPVYLEALKRKIHPETQNGLFILTVDPWNVSLNKTIIDLKDFPEEHSPLKNMYFYDISPNYEYLLRNYSRSWFKIYTEREEVGKFSTFLHKDGWLEVNVDMQKDSLTKREIKKEKFYGEELVKTQSISSVRLQALEDIIKFLQDKGTVYLVRVPPGEKLLAIENSYSPDFNQRIKRISEKYQVRYFDFSSKAKDYTYTDGNHMYKKSGKIFTSQIADSILFSKKLK